MPESLHLAFNMSNSIQIMIPIFFRRLMNPKDNEIYLLNWKNKQFDWRGNDTRHNTKSCSDAVFVTLLLVNIQKWF